MKSLLAAIALLAATAACNGGSAGTSSSNSAAGSTGKATSATTSGTSAAGGSTSAGSATTGASASGGATATGGTSTTGGTTSGGTTTGNGSSGTGTGTSGTTSGGASAGSPPGTACDGNAMCASGVCDVAGVGNCCADACSTDDPVCGAVACDFGGECVYPNTGGCGASSCTGSTLVQPNCDGNGSCVGQPADCPGSLACDEDAGSCLTSCEALADCVTGSYCVTDGGTCAAQAASGPCSENDACTSGVCGIAGSGNCCAGSCTSGDPTCGPPDCDPDTGACEYPDGGLACGTAVQSCSAGTEQDPSACDGQGSCAAPASIDCAPYACGATACLTGCTDDTSCGARGDFCDTAVGACCALAIGDSIAVDSANGSDSTPCCGTGTNGPCQTLTKAMQLIDAAKAQKVTINATVGDAGGDWAPAGEVYPIVLGWGVVLSAPGVYFYDPASPGNAEIFDVAPVSANDTIGFASIVGSDQADQIWIGMDSLGDQSADSSAIQVEAGEILYIANATVNGSATAQTTAITLMGAATMAIDTDESSQILGTLNVGGATLTDGWTGIACVAAGAQGCQIVDSIIGASSLVMQGQENVDIDAEDYSNITLAASPVIGVAPTGGFLSCPSKNDALSSGAEAVLLHGQATVSFSGTVQCISGAAFELLADGPLVPSLTLASSTVQNTEYGVYAQAGTATIAGSVIEFNYHGVQQDTDGTRIGAIDLSGGSSGTTNNVVCSSNTESIYAGGTGLAPGVSVLNTTANDLNASNTDWDTAGPDLFTCDDSTLATCTCPSSTCALAAGADGMDAVEASSGTVTTTGNGLSTIACGG